MGAFDKFRSADKLFWENSGIEISKKGNNLSLLPKRDYKEAYGKSLEEYYSVYGIDIFDNENINKIITMNGIGSQLHYTPLQVYV